MYLKPKAENISKKRQELGLSRHALSVKAGLGPYAIARMEESLHYVHPLRAKAVAEALGCSVDDLFEEVEENKVLRKVSGI